MYQFWGDIDDTLAKLFKKWASNAKHGDDSVIEDHHFKVSNKDTQSYHGNMNLSISLHEDINETKQAVGWQAYSNFYRFDFRKDTSDKLVIKKDMMETFPYPDFKGSRSINQLDYPVKGVVTEWHVIFLFDISL